MHNRNRAIVLEGALAMLTFTLMLGVAARAVLTQSDQSSIIRAGALTLHEPQTKPSPDPQQPDTPRPGPQVDKPAVLTGTIVRHGVDFVLRGRSGSVYRLDAPLKAEQYEGKPVKVTGKLDQAVRLIHVDNIEEITT